jgi:hypothetical protein
MCRRGGTRRKRVPTASAYPAFVNDSSSADATRRLLSWLVAVAFVMESLDTTIFDTAAPTVATALGWRRSCAGSTDIHALAACRIQQGMGGALLVPVGRLVVV